MDPKWRASTFVGPAIMEFNLWQLPGPNGVPEDETWFHEYVAHPMWRTNTPIGPTILEIRLWQVKDQTVFTEEDEAWFHAHVAQFQSNWVADEWYIKNKLTISEQDLDRANFSSSDNAASSSTAQLR